MHTLYEWLVHAGCIVPPWGMVLGLCFATESKKLIVLTLLMLIILFVLLNCYYLLVICLT